MVHLLASELAESLAVGGIPLFTDFPVSVYETVERAALEEWLRLRSEWTIVDVTPGRLALTEIRNLTLLPPESFIQEFCADLGAEINFQILKLRMFIQENALRPTIRVVAIAVPDQAVAGVDAVVANYEISVRFLDFCRRQLDVESSLFGLDPSYEAIAVHPKPLPEELSFEPRGSETPLEIAQPILTVEGLSRSGQFTLGDDIVKPIVKRFAEHFSRAGTKSTPPLLLQEIADSLRSTTQTASLVLDVLNDIGFAVPRTMGSDRVYRTGESYLELIESTPGQLGGSYALLPRTVRWSDEGLGEVLVA